VSGGIETKMTMSAGEGPGDRQPCAPEIEENLNTKWCRNWTHTRASDMAVNRETTMSVGERPSGGGVNPVPEMRVLD
jgi:hypothetical protein